MIRATKWRVASLKTDVLNIFKALNWVLSYPHPLCLHFQIPFFTIPFNKILNVGKKNCHLHEPPSAKLDCISDHSLNYSGKIKTENQWS